MATIPRIELQEELTEQRAMLEGARAELARDAAELTRREQRYAQARAEHDKAVAPLMRATTELDRFEARLRRNDELHVQARELVEREHERLGIPQLQAAMIDAGAACQRAQMAYNRLDARRSYLTHLVIACTERIAQLEDKLDTRPRRKSQVRPRPSTLEAVGWKVVRK